MVQTDFACGGDSSLHIDAMNSSIWAGLPLVDEWETWVAEPFAAAEETSARSYGHRAGNTQIEARTSAILVVRLMEVEDADCAAAWCDLAVVP